MWYNTFWTNLFTETQLDNIIPVDVEYLPADDQFEENLIASVGYGDGCEIFLFVDPDIEAVAELTLDQACALAP